MTMSFTSRKELALTNVAKEDDELHEYDEEEPLITSGSGGRTNEAGDTTQSKGINPYMAGLCVAAVVIVVICSVMLQSGVFHRSFGVAVAASPDSSPMGSGNSNGNTEATSASSFIQSDDLSFLTIGDWGQRNAGLEHVSSRMAVVAEKSHADFVVSVGDNFYEHGVRSVDDPQWKDTFEAVFTAPSLQKRWYVVAGNHDYRGSVQAQMDYSKQSPRWTMPALNYTTTFPIPTGGGSSHLQIIFIDTTPIIHVHHQMEHECSLDRIPIQERVLAVESQLEWFENELRSSTAEYLLVVGHHTVFSGGPHGSMSALHTTIEPLMQRYNVTAYVCGHDHNLQHLKEGNLDFFVVGSGSKLTEVKPIHQTIWKQSSRGFMLTTATDKALTNTFVDETGQEIYTVKLPPRVL